MSENIENQKKSPKRRSASGRAGDASDNFSLPVKKLCLAATIVIIAVIVMFSAFGGDFRKMCKPAGIGKGRSIEFAELKKEQIPHSIEAEIIPEYRELERALACIIDGKVYVLVTRGEKPTAGYSVSIDEIRLKKNEGQQKMIVKAIFGEPSTEDAVSQIITYPYIVAKTELKYLPDAIELLTEFSE